MSVAASALLAANTFLFRRFADDGRGFHGNFSTAEIDTAFTPPVTPIGSFPALIAGRRRYHPGMG
jgi:hypothetical protein